MNRIFAFFGDIFRGIWIGIRFVCRTILNIFVSLGYCVYLLGRRRSFWFLLSIALFVASVVNFSHYGLGKPLFFSVTDELSDTVKNKYPEEIAGIRKGTNVLFYGREIGDGNIDALKEYIGTKKKDFPIISLKDWRRQNPNDENDEQYQENAMNHLRYGVFASSEKIKELRSEMDSASAENKPEDKKVATTQVGNPKTGETPMWPFWLMVVMFFVPIFVGGWAFSHKFINWCELLRDYIREKRDEQMNKENTGSTPGAKTPEQSGLFSSFAKLYSSEIASDLSMKILGGLIGLLRRA